MYRQRFAYLYTDKVTDNFQDIHNSPERNNNLFHSGAAQKREASEVVKALSHK